MTVTAIISNYLQSCIVLMLKLNLSKERLGVFFFVTNNMSYM